jgi:hypothetical protein
MIPMHDLPHAVVEGCTFVEQVQPAMPTLLLRWEADMGIRGCTAWRLPGGIRWNGPWPRRFGVVISRTEHDAYAVRLIWDELYWVWSGLPATEIRRSAIAWVLNALGTDVHGILAQPVARTSVPEHSHSPRRLAA